MVTVSRKYNYSQHYVVNTIFIAIVNVPVCCVHFQLLIYNFIIANMRSVVVNTTSIHNKNIPDT